MRVRIRWPVLTLILLIAASAQAQAPPQQSDPEEPDYAFLAGGPYTQLRNSIQIIHATSFGTRRFTLPGGRRNEDEFVFFTRTEWGFTDRLELDVITPAQGSRRRDSSATLSSSYGYADTVLGVRYRLLDEEGAPITLTMGPQLILPTGSVREGLGAGSTGFAWDVSAAKDWRGPVFLFSSFNYSVLPRAEDTTPGSRARHLLHGLGWATAVGIRALENSRGDGARHDLHLMLEGTGSWEQEVVPAIPRILQGTREGRLSWAIAPGLRYGFLTKALTLTEIGVAVPIGLGPNGPKWGIHFQFQFERVFGRR